MKHPRFSKRALRIALAQAGMSQTEAAEKLDVATTTLNGWLNHRHPGPDDLADRLAALLGVNATDLLEDTTEDAQ